MTWGRNWLEHPLARGRELDDPSTTILRRQIISSKPFLQDIYRDWYGGIAKWVAPGLGPVVEIGSGAADPGDALQGAFRTDILLVRDLDVVMDAQRLPFRNASLGALVLVNVFHHIPVPSAFLGEAERCLKPDGIVGMIEPWLTPWSGFVYRHLHHEPVDATADWDLGEGGPLSGANSALPWIVFNRDLVRFSRAHPQLALVEIRPIMPLRYLLSGGVSKRAFMPGWMSGFWRAAEWLLQPLAPRLAMFALIILRRRT